jgi:protein-S-isoprenylcysteine O-methyltransferase Ste14
MLVRILGYMWMAFGLYWVILPPGRAGDSRTTRRLRVAVLVLSFAILYWKSHELPPPALILLASAWAMAALYWRATDKPRESGESGLYRSLRIAILIVSFVLLFWDGAAKGLLGERFLPPIAAFGYAGVIATGCGLLVALWARAHLGRYWSDRIRLTSDHQLVQSGPYAYLRHPIYSGVLAAVLGTALVVGEWRAILAFILLLSSYSIKAWREEQMLAKRFGAAFEQHRKRTGFLLPPLLARGRRAEP